jgi:two-component system sensor histidine kinase/response regulator
LEQVEKILIIDDDRALQESCRQVFAGKNYKVESAFDGISGLEMHRDLQPDLVLVDLCMPGIGGLEVLRKLKSQDPDYVAIVITGYGTITSAVEAMKRGAYDFLPKPFTPNQLRFIVQRGLERRRSIKETARLRREKQMMRDNFVAMVSHELRAPLAAVQQRLMLVTGGYTGEIPEVTRTSILGTQKRIKSLISLIGDWLNLSRIEAGEIAGPGAPVDLATVVAGIAETLRPLAEERNITLEVSTPDSLRPVLGHRDTLKMLFSNLVHNAIKYNRRGGRVLVRSAEEDGSIAIAVEDTGVGIPRDELPLVFEQFYRVKRDERMEGSGLGLSIAKKIAELHSGSIAVESEVGQGTVFTVRLPVRGQEKAEPEERGK